MMQNGLFSLFMSDVTTVKSANFELSQLKTVRQLGEVDFGKLLSRLIEQSASGDVPGVVLSDDQSAKLPAIIGSATRASVNFSELVGDLAEMDQITISDSDETEYGDLSVVWINFKATAGQSEDSAPTRGDIWIVPASEADTVDSDFNACTGTALLWWSDSIAMAVPAVTPEQLEAADGSFIAVVVPTGEAAETAGAVLWMPAPATEEVAMAQPAAAAETGDNETTGNASLSGKQSVPDVGVEKASAGETDKYTQVQTAGRETSDRNVPRGTSGNESKQALTNNGKFTPTVPKQESSPTIIVKADNDFTTQVAQTKVEPNQTEDTGKATAENNTRRTAYVVRIASETVTTKQGDIGTARQTPGTVNIGDVLEIAKGVGNVLEVELETEAPVAKSESEQALRSAAVEQKVTESVTQQEKSESKTGPEQIVKSETKTGNIVKEVPLPKETSSKEVRNVAKSELPVQAETKSAESVKNEQPVEQTKVSSTQVKTEQVETAKAETQPVKSERQAGAPEVKTNSLIKALLGENQETENSESRRIQLASGRTVTIREHNPVQSEVKVSETNRNQGLNVVSKTETTGQTVKAQESELQTNPAHREVSSAKDAQVVKESSVSRDVPATEKTQSTNSILKTQEALVTKDTSSPKDAPVSRDTATTKEAVPTKDNSTSEKVSTLKNEVVKNDVTVPKEAVTAKEPTAKSADITWTRFEAVPKENKTATAQKQPSVSINETKNSEKPAEVVKTVPAQQETTARETSPVKVSTFEKSTTQNVATTVPTDTTTDLSIESDNVLKQTVVKADHDKNTETLRMSARQQQSSAETTGNLEASGTVSEQAPIQKQESAVTTKFLNTADKSSMFSTLQPAETAFGNSESFSDGSFAKSGGNTTLLSSVTTNTPANSVQPAFEEALTDVRNSAATDDMSDQIVKGSKLAQSNGRTQFTIRLIPESLGQLDVTVTLENGKVHARLVASSDQAHKMLEKDVTTLKTALNSAGINWDRISIESRPQTESLAGHLNQGDQQHTQNGSTGGQFNQFSGGYQNKSTGWNSEADNLNNASQFQAKDNQNAPQPVFIQAGGLDITA